MDIWTEPRGDGGREGGRPPVPAATDGATCGGEREVTVGDRNM